jgi:hypothetical protein
MNINNFKKEFVKKLPVLKRAKKHRHRLMREIERLNRIASRFSDDNLGNISCWELAPHISEMLYQSSAPAEFDYRMPYPEMLVRFPIPESLEDARLGDFEIKYIEMHIDTSMSPYVMNYKLLSDDSVVLTDTQVLHEFEPHEISYESHMRVYKRNKGKLPLKEETPEVMKHIMLMEELKMDCGNEALADFAEVGYGFFLLAQQTFFSLLAALSSSKVPTREVIESKIKRRKGKVISYKQTAKYNVIDIAAPKTSYSSSKGTGVTQRPHWKRGHFKMQPFKNEKGESIRKQIWIMPYMTGMAKTLKKKQVKVI